MPFGDMQTGHGQLWRKEGDALQVFGKMWALHVNAKESQLVAETLSYVNNKVGVLAQVVECVGKQFQLSNKYNFGNIGKQIQYLQGIIEEMAIWEQTKRWYKGERQQVRA